MSLSSLIGISTAYAANAAPAAHPQGSIMGMLPMLILIVLVFYFLLVRPQQKRSKAQKSLMENIALGDEIVTVGGIVGKITKMRDAFVVLMISKDVEITMRKAAIESVLPKGTMENQ
jgi:preprotein translocase subunit YajC